MSGASAPQLAKRALVSLLRRLALVYRLVLAVTRDSEDKEVVKAWKKVLLRAHPDKGGQAQHAQELNDAKDKWDAAKAEAGAAAAGPSPPKPATQEQPPPQKT